MIPSAMNTNTKQTEEKKPEIIGLENINLKEVPLIDLRELLKPGEGGFNFTYLGAIKLEGQYGPYYIIGVEDQKGARFKFFSNKQLTNMLDKQEEPFTEVGTKFFIEMKFKPGDKYTTKNGEEKEVRGYVYNIQKID